MWSSDSFSSLWAAFTLCTSTHCQYNEIVHRGCACSISANSTIIYYFSLRFLLSRSTSDSERTHIYSIYKAAVSLSVCLFVCGCLHPPLFSTRPSDRNQIWHIYSDRYGKTFDPPQRGFRGSKIQKSGKCHEMSRKSINNLRPTPPWGWRVLGVNISKSPGNVMNCRENRYIHSVMFVNHSVIGLHLLSFPSSGPSNNSLWMLLRLIM